MADGNSRRRVSSVQCGNDLVELSDKLSAAVTVEFLFEGAKHAMLSQNPNYSVSRSVYSGTCTSKNCIDILLAFENLSAFSVRPERVEG